MDSKHHFQDRFLCQLMFLLCLCLTASNCSGSEVSVKLLGTPPASSNSSTATFSFAVFDNDNNAAGCPDCSFLCEVCDNSAFVSVSTNCLVSIRTKNYIFEAWSSAAVPLSRWRRNIFWIKEWSSFLQCPLKPFYGNRMCFLQLDSR